MIYIYCDKTMQAQIQLGSKKSLVALRSMDVRFISYRGPMQRTCDLLPALLLQAHNAINEQPQCAKTREYYAHMTDLRDIISLTGMLPMMHALQVAITTLQNRELYFPDLVRCLKQAKRSIKKAYIRSSSRFKDCDIFKIYLPLKAACSTNSEKQGRSPLVFSQLDDDEEVLCYRVKFKNEALAHVPLTAKPLPTASKRRLRLPQHIHTREQLRQFFEKVQV